jgi:hypothetical protein
MPDVHYLIYCSSFLIKKVKLTLLTPQWFLNPKKDLIPMCKLLRFANYCSLEEPTSPVHRGIQRWACSEPDRVRLSSHPITSVSFISWARHSPAPRRPASCKPHPLSWGWELHKFCYLPLSFCLMSQEKKCFPRMWRGDTIWTQLMETLPSFCPLFPVHSVVWE